MTKVDFTTYLNQAWNDHAEHPDVVLQNLVIGIKLVSSDQQISSLARLVTHVAGEHCGQWSRGVQLLKELHFLPCFEGQGSESEKEIKRGTTALLVAAGQSNDLQTLSRSDQICVLATAAAALSGQQAPEKAKVLLQEALEKAALGLPPTDPANRALAVASHNLACELEEKKNRTKPQRELMMMAAEASRKYWGVAGTWLEIERAEYRLAMTYLKAEDFAVARNHAEQCRSIVVENGSDPVELFFAYEAVALVEKAENNKQSFQEAVQGAQKCFQNLTEQHQKLCQPTLTTLLGK